jgi:hypothetical protein
MSKQKKRVSDDDALREFYEACGLAPNVIQGAINTRYQEPARTSRRETNLAKRLRERIPSKTRRAK